MIRFLPVVVLIILIIGSFFYLRSRFQTPISSPASLTNVTQAEVELAPQDSTLEVRVKALEDSILLLAKQIAGLKSGSGAQNTTSPMTDTKIKNLESAVANLQNQIDVLRGTSSQITPTSVKKSPVYIPLGSGGTANDRNWYLVTSYQASINPGDYPGYSNIQLEMVMNLNEAVGEARARIYSSSDKSAVSSSNVSTTSTTATLLTSGGFTLPSGAKTYVLQVQSTEGYTVNLQSARIKVNF